MRASRWIPVCAAAGLLLGACQDVEPEDGPDDPFLVDGKADVGGVVEGSADACGVLRLSNEADLAMLDDTVRLNRRAAAHIVGWRAGADGVLGTEDDRRFHSLAELDAVKYVGKAAFAKLLAYTQTHGLVCATLPLQVLAVSDWHGQLDPVSVAGVGNVGGASALSSYFRLDRAANANTLTLTAGDAFGATPPLASFFEERPAVLAMNAMGFDADGLGNHNFDRGVGHLAEMIELARYPFLSANLANVDANLSCPSRPGGRCVDPYRLFWRGGVKVAVIGVTNPDATELTKPGSFGTITITNPAAAAMAARDAAAAKGAQVFILIAHMGATGLVGGTEPTGPIIDLAHSVSGFDLILADHTNVPLSHVVNGQLVVENKSAGMTYARVRIEYDFASARVTAASAELVTPLADAVPPDVAIEELLGPFRAELSAAFDAPIAVATGVFERGMNVERLREAPIGNLLADAIRERYGVQIGFVNGGGIRAPLPSSYAPADHALRRPAEGYAAGPPFDLVVGDAYTVLPFGNAIVTRTVSGAQLWQMLEHGLGTLPGANGRFPQVSGIRVTFDSSRPPGSRVLAVTLADGTPVEADGTRYTLATSDFLDAGGDGYAMLVGGDGISRDKMADVLADHLRAAGTLTPATDGRLTDVAAMP